MYSPRCSFPPGIVDAVLSTLNVDAPGGGGMEPPIVIGVMGGITLVIAGLVWGLNPQLRGFSMFGSYRFLGYGLKSSAGDDRAGWVLAREGRRCGG